MHLTKLKLSTVPQFSTRDKAYIDEIDALRSFYKYSVDIESFAKVITDKKKDHTDRQLLADTLTHQYSNVGTTDAVKKNIALLRKDNTFTIITAHQPSLMTGPGYYFYKIFSVFNLVNRLAEEYTDYNFVPIFITGGEDHDFEEINHFSLYGKTLTWESDQKGSVGKFRLDQGFDTMFEALMNVIGEGEGVQGLKNSIINIKSQSSTYGQFAVRLTDLLFRDQGLVVADMSAPAFKKAFIPIIKKEIFEQPSVALVEATQKALEGADLKPQAMARPINFFYTGSGDRLRIDQEGDDFVVLDTNIKFTKDELTSEIENHPEFFSPNVVMRPIFQEFIFPNLAYIGGGGEIAYWLERKSQFEAFELNFPMLIRRNSGMVIDKGSNKKMVKISLTLDNIFNDTDSIITEYLESVSGDNLEFDQELMDLGDIFARIAAKAKAVDPSLESKMLAEGTKIAKQVDQLTSRIRRAAKQNEETSVNQISKIKDKLFPGLGLQERKACFLEIILKHGTSIIDELVPAFDPLEKTMIVVEE